MFNKAVISRFVMFVCVFGLGCRETQAPIRFEPIEPVPAAIVERIAVESVPLETTPLETQNIVPTIIMHSASFSCPPCEMWIRNIMPYWKKEGWTVPEPLKESVNGQAYPWFEIIDGDGLRFQVVGQLTRATYENERKKALGKK